MKRLALIAALGGIGTSAGTAQAQGVEEARLGVLAHNICITNCKNANKEDGPNVEGEVVFASPGFLEPVGAPRPYLMASVNVAGETSYGGGGLHWNWDFAEGWSLEPGLGIVVHDGETDNPFPNGTPESAEFFEENVLLGSEVLFRTSLSVNRDIGENWGVQFIYEHLSHGQILGSGRNQGLDNAGIRVFWRFGA